MKFDTNAILDTLYWHTQHGPHIITERVGESLKRNGRELLQQRFSMANYMSESF